MICPKCKGSIFRDFGDSYLSCTVCGTLHDMMFDIPMEVPREDFRPMKMTRTLPRDMLVVKQTIDSNRPNIAEMSASGKSWKAITIVIGVSCHWKTVRSLYMDGVVGEIPPQNSRMEVAIKLSREIIGKYDQIKAMMGKHKIHEIMDKLEITMHRSSFVRYWAKISEEKEMI